MARTTELLLDWTTSRDGGGEPGKRARVESTLRDAIRDGRLAPGTRLPSTRTLAADLGLSRGIVVEAYEQLVAEGWLETRKGSGTLVSHLAPARGAPPDGDVSRSDVSQRRQIETRPAVDVAVRYDFRAGLPDPRLFPRRDWSAALRDVVRELPDADLGYGDPRGPERARAVLLDYLRRVRGVVSTPDRVVLCGGFAQGLSLTCQVLARAGARTIIVEDPSGDEVRRLVAHAGLEPVPVPVDEHGLRTDRLPPARAALVTPAHQYPTGAVLAPERRRALLEWAAEHDAVVFEDDYDAEFRYDRDPVGSLQGRAPDRVAHGGSVSKTMAPGLRLGWLVVPEHLRDALAEQRMYADHGGPVVEQLALARLIATGAYERHVRRSRQTYRRRRDLLVAALAEHAPDARIEGVAAGLHLVLRLPAGGDAGAVAQRARRHGVGVGTTGADGLVLGYGALPDASIEPAAALLAKALG